MRIIVEPEGGLANRLRVLESTLALAERKLCPIGVVWTLNRYLNGRFSDLVEIPDRFSFVREVDTSGALGWLYYRAALPIRRLASDYYRETDCWRLKEQGVDYRESEARVRYFRLCSPFMRGARPYAWVRPAAPIRATVDSLRLEKSIGVHIRRTDNLTAIAHSPTTWFIDMMSDEVAKDAETTFFIATDEPAEEARIVSAFAGRVRVYPKRSSDRAVAIAAHDAAVDLFALASCRKIIGSRGSSFSGVAAEIGGRELILNRDACGRESL